MGVSAYNNRVDEQGREMIEHGTVLFPIGCYHDDLREEGVPWHWHSEFEALVVTEGSAVAGTDTGQFTLSEGQGCLVNVNVLHAMRNNSPGKPCRFHSMSFHPRLAGGSTESIFWEKYVMPVTENRQFSMIKLTPQDDLQSRILGYVEDTWQNVVYEPENYEIKTRYNLSMIFALAGRMLHASAAETDKPRGDVIREERMKKMLQYIHQKLDGELNTADIARAASISESECLRSFKKIIQTTPMRYVQQLRMQKASDLLAHTRLSVSEVAQACGYLDLSYFSRVFRAGFGMTPGQYRHRKKEQARESQGRIS